MDANAKKDQLELEVTRIFKAPRRLVFEAWTKGEHLDQWRLPAGFTRVSSSGDVRPGGAWRSHMRAADGLDFRISGIYRDVVADELVSFTHAWEDEAGARGPETIVTVRLADEGVHTRLTLVQSWFTSAPERDGHKQGWSETLDGLGAFLRAPATISLVVARQFGALPETVFDAWLDVESVAQWMFSTPGGVMEKVEITPRVGGGFEIFERRGAQLATHFGTFVEIDRPHRLAFDFTTDREQGSTRVSVDFEARDGGCFVTLTHALDPQWAAYGESVRKGWSGILEGLALALQGETRAGREIVQMREYDAPREMVWEAWTKPEHVDQWWGPDGFVTRTESMDVRPNGFWRFTMTGPDGTVFPNHQFYVDVSAPERLIYTHGAGDEAAPPRFHVAVIFEMLGADRTRVRMTSRFPSKAARDWVVEKYGAIEGGKQTMARLAKYLEVSRR